MKRSSKCEYIGEKDLFVADLTKAVNITEYSIESWYIISGHLR